MIALAVALLYLQWLPAVRAVEEAARRPVDARRRTTSRCCGACDAPRARRASALEVPAHARPLGVRPTSPTSTPLARGWHRQLDRKVNPLFYDQDQPLSVDGYERWLRDNAVRWVALPDAPLDFSGRHERRPAARPRPAVSCEPVQSRRDWRIWEVRDPEPPVCGRGAPDRRRRRRLRPRGEPRRQAVIVRQHATPYWAVAVRRRLRVGRTGHGLDARRRAPPGDAARARALLRARRAAARAALRSRLAPSPRVRSTPLFGSV